MLFIFDLDFFLLVFTPNVESEYDAAIGLDESTFQESVTAHWLGKLQLKRLFFAWMKNLEPAYDELF